MNETPRLRKDDGHLGRGRGRQRPDRRPDRADAAGQGAPVQVQGACGRRAGAGQDVRVHATPTSASRAPPTTASTPTAATVTSTTSAASAAAAGVAAAARWRGGGGRGGGGFGGLRRRRRPTVRDRGAAGFGVRVIHSGVWGFASSPIVTEDEIKRITLHGHRGRQGQRDCQARRRQARAGAGLPGVLGDARSRRIRATVPQEEKQALVQKVVDLVVKTKEVTSVNASVQLEHEWKYFASSEGSYIEQETCTTTPQFTVTARKDGETRTRVFTGVPMTGGWEVAEAVGDGRERRAYRRRSGGVLHRQAGRDGRQGSDPHAVARDADDPRDRRARHRARSHPRLRGELRRHQLREADRRRQAEIRLEAVQRHRRPHHPRRRRHDRLRRRRREDAAVAARARRDPGRPADQPRDRRHSSARRRAAAARRPTRGATIRSCACRTSTSSRARRDRRRRRTSSPTPRTAC